ncbi:MAG: alpha/beta fold hydrolase [Pseudomonadota bacterium]
MKLKTPSLLAIWLIGLASLPLVGIAGDAPKVRTTYSCYDGPFGDYEQWVSALSSRNPALNKDEFEVQFPEAEYDGYKATLECAWFDYLVDGVMVRGFYAKPRNSPTTPYPAIIVNRGGNGTFGAATPAYLMRAVFPLAAKGFFVIGTQYRGIKYGNWGPSVDYGADEFGGMDVDDVLGLIPIIEEMPQVNHKKLGIIGWSRGGMMALLAARRSDRFATIAVVSTPVDLAATLRFRPEMERVYRQRIPNYEQEKESALASRSAIGWVNELPASAPILVLHGQADDRVSAQQALSFASRLQDLARPYKLVVYEGGSHSLVEHQDEVDAEVVSWFRDKLSVAVPPRGWDAGNNHGDDPP